MGSIGIEKFHNGATTHKSVECHEKQPNILEIPPEPKHKPAKAEWNQHRDNSGGYCVEDGSANTVPIAIVGMGMRLPGNVRSADDFWDLLCSKRDVGRDFPEDRFNIDAFYSSSNRRGVKTRRGYFLDQNIADTDPSAFGTTKTGTTQSDPQQRLLLEVVFEAFENAGVADWHGKDVGCFVGTFGEDHLENSLRDPLLVDRYQVFGSGDFALSNRISHEFDLRGPRYVLLSVCWIYAKLTRYAKRHNTNCVFSIHDCFARRL
jgi:hypothetical protein